MVMESCEGSGRRNWCGYYEWAERSNIRRCGVHGDGCHVRTCILAHVISLCHSRSVNYDDDYDYDDDICLCDYEYVSLSSTCFAYENSRARSFFSTYMYVRSNMCAQV